MALADPAHPDLPGPQADPARVVSQPPGPVRAMSGGGHDRLPPFIHDLTTTVCAPAAALSDRDGQIRSTGLQGLFVADTRVLAAAVLRFGGTEPQALAALAEGSATTRFVTVARGFGDVATDPTVRLERVRQLTPTGLVEEIQIGSTAMEPVAAEVTIDLNCDLSPLELVKVGGRHSALPALLDGGSLLWRDGASAVRVQGEGAVMTADPPRLRWPVDLPPGGRTTLRWSVHLAQRRAVVVSPACPVEWAGIEVTADDPRLDRLVGQALDDLAALRLAEPDHPEDTFLGAGVPWFLTLFGRDSIWAARMMLPLGTDLAAGTLRTLARRQGRRVDKVSGEAPGKILHELRQVGVRIGDWGRLPASYYGTIDATLLWISLLADAWRWGMPESSVAYLLPNLTTALFWLDRYGDPDGDGFVEYVDHSGRGLANQGWKDSGTAVRFHDGRAARPPIALCEVQGYAHRAALDAAELIDAFGDHTGWDRGAAHRWREYAAVLSERFRRRFWVDGPLGPFPAMAIDADGRQVDALTSNIGHLLGTGLLSADEEGTVARLLASAPLADGYGLRTMSTLDAGYAPLSYHCGSVWPHDTAIAMLGLARAGAHAASAELLSSLLAAAPAFGYRLPELYGGDRRADLPRPLPHPGACRPQAWSAAVAITIVQALLGLDADVPRRQVRISPMAGIHLGAVRVRGLRVSEHPFSVDLSASGEVTTSGLPAWLRLVGPDQTSAGPPQGDGDARERGSGLRTVF